MCAAGATAGVPRRSCDARTLAKEKGPPARLRFHLVRMLRGMVGIFGTGGMYRGAIADVSAWITGDFNCCEHWATAAMGTCCP